jgi:chemotaxis protein MotA
MNKATTGIGILVAFLGLFFGMVMEGGSPAAFLNLPALLIIVGGTLGATVAGTSLDRVKQIPALYKKAMSGEKPYLQGEVDRMVTLAEKARREGLLALEDDIAEIPDAFTRKGLQLVVDGTDPELVREILENEIDGMIGRHKLAVQPFEKAGGFAPTMGILGTVLGLVHVLENLDAPETLGPAISGAFIATLYGVGAANVILLPTANRLKLMSEEEVEARTLVLEGILAIQAGDNPRVVADKLLAFVPPSERPDSDSPQPVTEGRRVAEAASAAAA